MLFDVHLDIFAQKMYKHSFDLWVYSFLFVDENADDDHDFVLMLQLIVELNDELVEVVTSYVARVLAVVVVDDN
jgi:hypothetical protein